MGSVISIHMDEMLRAIRRMDPEAALEGIAGVLKALFATLGDDARSQFLWDLMGEFRNDKVSSLVQI
jgi:hypothetical protein